MNTFGRARSLRRRQQGSRPLHSVVVMQAMIFSSSSSRKSNSSIEFSSVCIFYERGRSAAQAVRKGLAGVPKLYIITPRGKPNGDPNYSGVPCVECAGGTRDLPADSLVTFFRQ